MSTKRATKARGSTKRATKARGSTKRATKARGWSWKRGRPTALLCLLAAVLLVFPGIVPNTPGHVGSLLETFLPWLGLAVPVLLAPALLRRSLLASAALLLPVAAWSALFGSLLFTWGQAPDSTFTVVQHNISDENPDPAAAARSLAAADADLVALEEVTAPALLGLREGPGRGLPPPRDEGHGRPLVEVPAHRRTAGGHQAEGRRCGLGPWAACDGPYAPG